MNEKSVVKLVVGACFILFNCAQALAQQSSTLNAIAYSVLPGGDVRVSLVTDGDIVAPNRFSTDNPARIALDFFGMQVDVDQPSLKISSGKVESVMAVETSDRTRIIVNLTDVAEYDLDETEDGYSVTIYNTELTDTVDRKPEPFASRPELASDNAITNIDFRRSSAGGGSLEIRLNDETVTVDTSERDGEIIVDLIDITIPREFERRLDVTDFATPVRTVDAFQNGNNVRIIVAPQGRYQHLSFQSADRFNLVVDPVIESEEDAKNREDGELGYEGERLSINFQKIDVRSALAVIADFTGINFVTSDSVQGEITINLKDVPWDQALDVIMKTQGLAKRQNGNVIWVAPAQEIAKIEEEELKAKAAVREFAPLVSEIVQINYAKAEDIADVIKSIRVLRQGQSSASAGLVDGLLSSSSVTETDKNSLLTSRGSVTVDVRTNSLLVQDVAAKISELRKVIAQLDKPVRQVMIETRIVEASDTFIRELGARLGFQRITENARFPGASGSNIGNFVGSGSTEGVTTIQDSINDDEDGLIFDVSRGTPGGLSVDLGASGIDGLLPAAYAFDIFKAGAGYAHLITLELSALEADGRGKVVASPRLVTANQKEANIKQGEERVFTVLGNDSVSVETKEAVLELLVTPQITPDDRVVLDVKVTQDTFIANADQNIAAALRRKEIITQVLADNGETIVIGGIYQEESNQGSTKVPFLGDIPILGRLFKKTTKREIRTELLIFLTPKIISPKLDLG